MQITTTIQQESSGCGIACTAMLAGKSYAEVKQKANQLGIFAGDDKLWSETGYVRCLLGEYEIKAAKEETPFTTWDAVPNLALLAIKFRLEKGRSFWHWTVFQRTNGRKIVHDPASSLAKNERDDFEKIIPQWFIEIEKT